MILAALAGFVVCAAITYREHSRDHWLWGRRLGHSRFRTADLPLGGCVLAALGFALNDPLLLAAAGGMLVAAPMGGVLDPLPPV